MDNMGLRARQVVVLVLAASMIVALPGCGGTKVLKEPEPLDLVNSLATNHEESISVTLEWVIVRAGPGTWAKNADWDEYLLTVSNQSDVSIKILDVFVVDSLETRLVSNSKRKKLVKGSKETAKRYKGNDLKVKAGFGAGTMIATGAAVAVVGSAAAYGAAAGALASGAASAGGAAAAAGGIVLLAPVLVVGGIVRGANNRKVSKEIIARHTELPLAIAPGESAELDLFFPLAPSPSRVEIIFDGSNGIATLIVDTSDALQGLHLVSGQSPVASE